jgi:para-nitrobenzyl esterase
VDGTVGVDGGWVRGRHADGVWVFRAIPYARAPEGPLRWRPPQRPQPWSGVRDVVEPGALAPQTPPSAGTSVPGDPDRQSEDCLHLTVWTPGSDAGRRPVMVWIHGGGFTTGFSGSVLYDGAQLASRGDVVVVTVNYRLGALGFMAHRALGGARGADFGNWGLLDQIAGLRWVHDHIASFGGDPDTVTIFGESAGAMSVCALLVMPAARGLFHRAVVQSGPPYVHTVPRAARAAEELAAALGLPDVDRRALEVIPAPTLVDAAAEMQRRPPPPGELPLPFLPTVDGMSLPEAPLAALARGAAARVPLIVGTNRDEAGFFVLSDSQIAGMDEEAVLRHLHRSAPVADPKSVVDSYRAARSKREERVTPRDVWVAAASDLVFRWPSLRLAAAHGHHDPRTYVYLFDWETPIFDGALGACHALEIPFVFGTQRHPVIGSFVGAGEAADALSEEMQSAWLAFARYGDPSGDVLGRWPAWEPEERSTMVFGRRTRVVDSPRHEELCVWEALAPLEDALGGAVR